MKTSKNYIKYIYLVGVIIFFYIISRYIFGSNKTIEGFQPFNYLYNFWIAIFNFWMNLFKFWYNVFKYGILVWRWNLYYYDPFGYISSILVDTSNPPQNPANDTNVPTWVTWFFPAPVSQ